MPRETLLPSDRSREASRDFAALDAGSEWANYIAPSILLREGKLAEAREAVKRMPRGPRYGSDLMEAALGLRPPSQLDRLAKAAVEASRKGNDPEPLYAKGAVLEFAGKREAALQLLRAAIENKYCSYSALEHDPLLDKLRATPTICSSVGSRAFLPETGFGAVQPKT